jgi:hypothetical protein
MPHKSGTTLFIRIIPQKPENEHVQGNAAPELAQLRNFTERWCPFRHRFVKTLVNSVLWSDREAGIVLRVES